MDYIKKNYLNILIGLAAILLLVFFYKSKKENFDEVLVSDGIISTKEIQILPEENPIEKCNHEVEYPEMLNQAITEPFDYKDNSAEELYKVSDFNPSGYNA